MHVFHHFQPKTVDDAVALLRRTDSEICIIAGGTDLLGCLKDKLWLKAPDAVVNLKSITGLDTIGSGRIQTHARHRVQGESGAEHSCRLFDGQGLL